MTRSRPKPKRSKALVSPWLLLLVGFVGIGGVTLSRMDLREEFEKLLPVRYVRVEGQFCNLSPGALTIALSPVIGRGYFSVDLGSVEQSAVSVPWVGQAKASRTWPDTIVIELKEESAVARWGKTAYLGENGEVFNVSIAAEDGYRDLPRLAGPAGREKQVVDMMNALNAKLAERELHVTELTLSNRLAWEAVLSNGLEITYGDQDPLALTDRAFSLLSRLGEQQVSAVEKLDLRYEKGFVVVWKPTTPAVVPAKPQGVSSNMDMMINRRAFKEFGGREING